MLKKFKLLKDQRGLTLIELLVVVVILGIIAAIAVPSIGGLINNSKIDAHIGNANQMISAARLAVTAESNIPTDGKSFDMTLLVADGYMESIPSNPSDAEYNPTASVVAVTVTGVNYTYKVTLEGGAATNGTKTYIVAKEQSELDRGAVDLTGH